MKFNLPKSPGVYIFKDKSGKPIYIGKSQNISRRVRDHFLNKGHTYKEDKIINNTVDIETIGVDSDIEALILEANLIKNYNPHFNSQLKDDRDYLYIKITKDPFPKVLSVRKNDLKQYKSYFGPFPSSTKVRETLRTLRKIFPYSTCKPNQKRACLQYHLGLCPGVCLGKIQIKDYLKNIKAITYFLNGKRNKVIENLEKERNILSKYLHFEEAEQIQKKIDALIYITRPTRIAEDYLEKDIKEIRNEELIRLANLLNLNKSPSRIECYDISNIGSQYTVGSMVVFYNGEADKRNYRRFKIKNQKSINDISAISEVLERRFNNDWEKPDLIIVDGGKGQLNTSLKVIKKYKLNIPVIALAKRLEDVYIEGNLRPLKIDHGDNALKLLQRIRDEAHRFAINYYRKLHRVQILTKN